MAGFVERHVINVLLGQSVDDRWRTLRFKAPIYAWRLGMRHLLPQVFACITTRGRKTGMPRYTMVTHFVYGNRIYVASGFRDEPDWVQNLLDDPTVTLQPAHGEPIKGRAERVQGKDDLQQAYQAMRVSPIWVPWLMSLDIKPKVEDFIAKRERVYLFTIQVGSTEALEPAQELPALEDDLRWVSRSALLGTAMGLTLRWREVRRKRRTER